MSFTFVSQTVYSVVIFSHRFLDSDCVNFKTFAFLAVYWPFWIWIAVDENDKARNWHQSSTIFKINPPQVNNVFNPGHPISGCRLAFKRWKRNGNFIFLGSTKADRLPIFSFLIVHPKTGKMLHHNFIAVLLNDLYGIQARGGCACAGPYAQVYR